MSFDIYPVREETVLALAGDQESQVITAQNFALELWQPGTKTEITRAGEFESMVLITAGRARIEFNGETIELAERSLAIVPAGSFRICVSDAAQLVIVLANPTPEQRQQAVNARQYEDLDERIVPANPNYTRVRDPGSMLHYEVAELTPLPHAAGSRLIQSEAISINWVEYDGERNPTRLTPHNHTDIEQASLGLSGQFVYHLRVPWTPDSTGWRPDRHALLDAPCVSVFPVGLVHTVAGSRESGHNCLIDVFSPVREDFVNKGWIANATDYALIDG